MANTPGKSPTTQNVPLAAFRGWVTDAAPHDLPEGLSPDAGNCEFVVGAVNQRDGIQNLFAFEGETDGPNGPSSGTNVEEAYGLPWTNPSNITLDDGNYATLTLGENGTNLEIPAEVTETSPATGLIAWSSIGNLVSPSIFTTVVFTGSGQSSQLLTATQCGFDIPSGATITGIQANWESGTTGSGQIQHCYFSNNGFAVTPLASIPIRGANQADEFGNSKYMPAGLTPAVINSSAFGFSIQITGGGAATIKANNLSITVFWKGGEIGDALNASNFSFALSSDTITGVQVGITGHIVGTGTLMASLTDAQGNSIGTPKPVVLPEGGGSPPGDMRIVLGAENDLWGAGSAITPNLLNNSGFGVNLFDAEGTGSVEFNVSFVDVTVSQAPSGSAIFNWIKTYERSTGNYNLAITANGVLWIEDLQNSPGLLNSAYTGLFADSFAKSCTFDNREFIGLSDLSQGYDMPRQWCGPFATNTNSLIIPDQSAANQGNGTALSVGPVTPSQLNGLALCCLGANTADASTFSSGSGWTIDYQASVTDPQDPPSIRQSNIAAYPSNSSSPVTISFNENVVEGNLIIIFFYDSPFGEDNPITDSQGNSYLPSLITHQFSRDEADEIWCAWTTASASGSLTISVPVAEMGYSTAICCVEVEDWSSVDNNGRPVFAKTTEVSSVSVSSSTTNDDDLVIAFAGGFEFLGTPTFTAPDGWTVVQTTSEDSGVIAGALISRVIPSASSYTAEVDSTEDSLYFRIAALPAAPPAFVSSNLDFASMSQVIGSVAPLTGTATLSNSAEWDATMATLIFPGGAAPTVVQSLGTSSPNAVSVSFIELTLEVGENDFLVVTAASLNSTLSIGDSFNSNWSQIIADQNDSNVGTAIFFTRVGKGGINTITLSASMADTLAMAVYAVVAPPTAATQHLDRISQCGPAFAPSVAWSSTQYDILASPNGLVQESPILFPIPPDNTYAILSAGPGSTAVGSLLQFFFNATYSLPTYITPGINIVLSGLPPMSGFDCNNGVGTNPAFYTVIQTGGPIKGNPDYCGLVVQVPTTGYDEIVVVSPTVIQPTSSTVITSVPVPNLEVGGSFNIVNAANSAWDGNFTVETTPNAAQLQITETSLTSGVAVYNYNLIVGTDPIAGQLVTVTNTDNGNGIFNGNNLTIASATSSQFTVAVASANVLPGAEDGSAVVSGTTFTFDPLKVITASGGGYIVVGGDQTISPGVRKVVCLFETRNGLITAPSPYFQFSTVLGVTSLTVSNVPLGGPEVLQRIIAFTPADSDNFYYLPQSVLVNTSGINITYAATVIPDNTTTGPVTFNFTDDVITGGTPIDQTGNDLFSCAELGNVLGCNFYQTRLMAWGEQSYVPNFGASLSFNGGYYYAGNSTNVKLPGGWTIDPVNGFGGSIVNSPVYGLSYQISNTTGDGQALIGMISQSAYQDQYLTPILFPNITYGIRATCSCPSTAVAGSVTFDLYDPVAGRVFGTFSIPLNEMNETLSLFTGTLLPSAFGIGGTPPVPSGLILRVYGRNFASGITALVDRFEIYDLNDAVNQSQVRVSYGGNPEAFDASTGLLDISGFTDKPITDVFVDRDIVYIAAGDALFQTQNNGISEPSGWTIRQTTDICGSLSVNGTAGGEEWHILAAQAGLFIFWGSEPVSIIQEIQQVWNLIDWNYADSITCVVDLTNRLLQVAVPIPTGPGTVSYENGWMVDAPPNSNPTTPNIVLNCSIRQLNTAESIADSPAIHTLFTGKTASRELSRKWCWNSIPTNYMTSILRADGTQPTVYCSSTQPKIYSQAAGATDDDGNAIGGTYITSAFVSDDTAEGLHITNARREYLFMWMLASGMGNLNVTTLPNTIDSPYANALVPFQLYETPFGDLECPLQEEANRLFIKFGCNQVGATFSMSRIVMAMRQAPHIIVTGIDSQGV